MNENDDQAVPSKGSAPIHLANDASSAQTRRKEKVQVGELTPDFTLLSQSSGPVSLGDFFGKQHIVLYFYPKNNTSLCTEEACAFRDNYESFKEAEAEVIGVSSDTVESHRQFAKEYQLPFILLSDVDGAIRKQYGVPTAFGLPGRVTYIIDRQGIVRRIFFSQFTSKRHVEEALETLHRLNEEHL